MSAADSLADFINSLGDLEVKANTIFHKWEEIRKAITDLVKGRKFDEAELKHQGTRVVTVRTAIDGLEQFRIGKLKERLMKIYEEVKQAIDLIKTPPAQITANVPFQPANLPRASAFAFRIQGIVQRIGLIGDGVILLEDKVLEIISLIDFISTIQDDMRTNALQQGNREVPAGQQLRMRLGNLHG